MSLQFTTASGAEDVRQILALQAANLPAALSAEAMAREGFVTVHHDPAVLARMNADAPAIIARDTHASNRVVAYALVMPRAFAPDVPILLPLFARLERLSRHGGLLRDNPRWFVMGQICVAAGYRGTGVVDGLYAAMREVYRERFDFTVTEVAARNTRSLRAHERVGFETIDTYRDEAAGEVWRVIALDLV
jgi:ribosomal protein S18 acetylase RimI-like enzyme